MTRCATPIPIGPIPSHWMPYGTSCDVVCPGCASFAAKQQALDQQLRSSLHQPALSPSFRPALRQRIREERRREWFDALPDLVHIGGCRVVTCASALLQPVDAAVVLGTGATMTIASYGMMAVLRSALDDSDR